MWSKNDELANQALYKWDADLIDDERVAMTFSGRLWPIPAVWLELYSMAGIDPKRTLALYPLFIRLPIQIIDQIGANR